MFSKIYPGEEIRNILRTEYDYLLIDQPLFLRFTKLFPENSKIILRLTDKPKNKAFKLICKNMESISGLIVTNPEILNNLKNWNIPKLICPNGFPEFSPIIGDEKSRNGIIYIGKLDDRIDWEFINHISILPEFNFLHIYGDGVLPNQLPNGVSYIGPLKYEDVPKVCLSYKYGLLPFNSNEANMSRSPMKLGEFSKSGLNILIPKNLSRQLQNNLKLNELRNLNLKSYSRNSELVVQWPGDIATKDLLSWKEITDNILSFIMKINHL